MDLQLRSTEVGKNLSCTEYSITGHPLAAIQGKLMRAGGSLPESSYEVQEPVVDCVWVRFKGHPDFEDGVLDIKEYDAKTCVILTSNSRQTAEELGGDKVYVAQFSNRLNMFVYHATFCKTDSLKSKFVKALQLVALSTIKSKDAAQLLGGDELKKALENG